MPDLRLVIAGWNLCYGAASVGAREHGPRTLGHEGIGDHVVVNVATERGHAGVVERDGGRFFAPREGNLELLDGRKGINLMRRLIVVGKDDMSAFRHNRDEWNERFAALIDGSLGGKARHGY